MLFSFTVVCWSRRTLWQYYIVVISCPFRGYSTNNSFDWFIHVLPYQLLQTFIWTVFNTPRRILLSRYMQSLPHPLQWPKYCCRKSWYSFKIYCNFLYSLGILLFSFNFDNGYFNTVMVVFYYCKHSNDCMLVNKEQFCKHSNCKTKE